jgi:SAM-dependent methyltransferase
MDEDQENARQYYNRLYRGWYRDFETEAWVDLIDRWKPGKLLEVACGKGGFLKQAAALGFDVSGIDISDVALEAAALNIPQADLRLSAAEDLPFDERSFDYVVCLGSLEHFLDPAAAAAEMSRVLKNEGRALVVVPNSHHVEAMYDNLRYGVSSHDGQAVELLATRWQWVRLLGDAGLRVVETKGSNKRPPLRPFKARSLILRVLRPFIPLNISYLFLFECERGNGERSEPWSYELRLKKPLPPVLKAGADYNVKLRVRNRGYAVWMTPKTNIYPVNVGWHVDSRDGTRASEGRAELKKPLAYGDAAVVSCRLRAPEVPGSYSVTFDLVREGDFWLGGRGGEPARMDVEVRGRPRTDRRCSD